MAKDRMILLKTLRMVGVEKDIDFLKKGVKVLAKSPVELEI